MSGKGRAAGLKSFLGALVAVVLFPVFWARSLRLARRHTDADPRGPAKVAVACAASLAILAVGAFTILGFERSATEGMYGSLDMRLQAAVGETEYQENLATVAASDVAIPIIERNLANATASGDSEAAGDLQDALNQTRAQRDRAAARAAALEQNHALYLRLQPIVERQDDDALRSEVAAAGLSDPRGMQEGLESALAIKDQSVADMRMTLWLFAWPSLFGAFVAPVVFALGSILKNAFVPSDTVGYKPYPGAAAGFFLLFGAFGVPAVPFAAWVHLDAERRSREGQISL